MDTIVSGHPLRRKRVTYEDRVTVCVSTKSYLQLGERRMTWNVDLRRKFIFTVRSTPLKRYTSYWSLKICDSVFIRPCIWPKRIICDIVGVRHKILMCTIKRPSVFRSQCV